MVGAEIYLNIIGPSQSQLAFHTFDGKEENNIENAICNAVIITITIWWLAQLSMYEIVCRYHHIEFMLHDLKLQKYLSSPIYAAARSFLLLTFVSS